MEQGRLHLERSLSQLFNAPVHIDRVTLTPRKLILRGVSLQPQPKISNPLLVIDRLQIRGSLLSVLRKRSLQAWWEEGGVQSVQINHLTLLLGGVPLQAQGRVNLIENPGGPPRCEGWLSVEHPLITGRLEVSGSLSEPILLGELDGVRGGRRFVSRWAVTPQAIRCLQMEIQGGWILKGNLETQAPFFKGLFQLQGPGERFELRVESSPSEGGHAALWMYQEDQIPEKIDANWLIKKPYLHLTIDLFGRRLILNGRFDMRPPYPLALTLDFKEVDVGDAAMWLLPRRGIPPMSGRLLGKVDLSGSPRLLTSEGEVFTDKLTFGQAEFANASLRFQGIGPILQIHNSQMIRPSGVVLMDGVVDVRRVGRRDFFAGVKLSSLEKGLSWEGWRMDSAPGSSGLQLHRPGGSNRVSVGLDYKLDTGVTSEPVEREEVRVGYPLSSGEKVSIRLNKDEEFLGVEHRNKF